MRITNKLNLPESFVSAVTYDDYTGHGTLSVTSLLVPTQALVLARRHEADIEEDAANRVWLLLGSAAHEVLRRSKAGEDERIEERLSTTLEIFPEEVVVSGEFDILRADGRLEDYKVTSAWVILHDSKLEDWWLQLSMYRTLCAANGVETSGHGRIIAILRDWSLSKAKQGGNYPELPVVVRDFELMPPEAGMNHIRTRATAFVDASQLPDADLPPCSPKERIQQASEWAVYKGQNKRATKLFEDQESANAFAGDMPEKDKARVEQRPGRFVRCDDYCSARPWCHQLKREEANAQPNQVPD
jgi:hypothetical protein